MLLTWYITYPDSYPVMTNIPPTQSWPSRHTSGTDSRNIHVDWEVLLYTYMLPKTNTSMFRGPSRYIYVTSNKHTYIPEDLLCTYILTPTKTPIYWEVLLWRWVLCPTKTWHLLEVLYCTYKLPLTKTQRHSTHRHSSLDLHVTSNKNTYFRGPTLYTHVTSNKDSHCLEVPVSTGDK